MQPKMLGAVVGVGAAAAAIGIAMAVNRAISTRDAHDIEQDSRKFDALESFESARAERRRIGAFVNDRVIRGRGEDTYQASLGAKLVADDFTDLGDALTAARALGDGPHAVVPFTRSLWFEDSQAFGDGDRVQYSVYEVDPKIREAYGTYSTMTSSTDFTGGGLWIQDGADVWGLEPWNGTYSEDPVLTKVSTLPQVPPIFDDIAEDIGTEEGR